MPIAAVRLTRPTVEVLRLLLAASAEAPLWGAKIGEQTDLGKSSVSQILTRLTALGWVTAREEETPHPGRPARIFRVLTEMGRCQAEAALAMRRVRNECRQAPTDAPRAVTDQTARSAQSAAPNPDSEPKQPRMAAHWPVRLPDLDRLHRSASAASGAAAAGPGSPADGAAYEHLSLLKEALSVINRTVTRDLFTQAVADPAHTLEYEPVLTAIGMEAAEIRKKTLYAPRARSG